MEDRRINRAESNELWYELFKRKGAGWMTVITGSMTPLIRSGDQVLIQQTNPESIRFGDIVMFRRDMDLIVHRVLKRRRTADGFLFTEKGDAVIDPGKFKADSVVGRITMVKRENQILNLDSPLSKAVNLVLSVCIFCIGGAIIVFKFPENRPARKIPRLFSALALVSANLLVRVCFAVWYLSGLNVRNHAHEVMGFKAK
jgi:signal peptidase I